MPSDAELLLRYARNRDEAAFAEIVHGHIALVYSAAIRRVGGDAHAAAEITQSVFVALARNAERLAKHPVLNAWLHASTRNAAANLRRREQRRDRQLQEIQVMHELNSSERLAQEWQSIRGVLDESLDELGESDRQAIILRFFENQTYPAIGGILGLQEEAARMRVGRALETLRTRLARRGIASTAALLSGALSANSVVSVPAGLAASTAAAAAATTVVGTTLPLTGILQIMSITKLTGIVVVVAVIGSLGTIAYRSTHPSPASPPVVEPKTSSITTTKIEKPALSKPSVRDDQTAPVPAFLPPGASEADDKIAALRDLLRQFPEYGIPELKLATDADWHVAVEEELQTPDDYKRALGKLRSRAENRFAKLLQPSIRAFMEANNRQFPTETAQLLPLIREPLDAAMLARYHVAPASEIPNVRIGSDWMITQNSLVDVEYDNHLIIGSSGMGATSTKQSSSAVAIETVRPLIEAYRAASGATNLNDISELTPYATTPEQKAAIDLLKKQQARSEAGAGGGAIRSR
jgi:RNA polymerase sigma factor (sigma-70 family)